MFNLPGFFLGIRRHGVRGPGLPVILGLVAAGYLIAYAVHPVAPRSASPDASGWWGWHDQGRYLTSAKALARGDFSQDEHFYPPLYPALGALFLGWTGGHVFFALNLAAFLWFCFVFIRVSDQYLPRWGGVSVLLLALLVNWRVSENYVIPWNSILTDALTATGILALVWLAEAERGVRSRVTGWQIGVAALCLGLIVPTRPPDAVVGAIIGAGLVLGCRRLRHVAPGRIPGAQALAISWLACICGPLLLLGFNRMAVSAPTESYVVRHAGGYLPADLPEKFFSFWLDASALYGRPGVSLTECYPWLLVSLAGLLWILIRGDRTLRVVGFAMVALFVTYLPFAFIIPNALWKFMNIHYFKWTFPYFGLFAVLLARDAVAAWRRGSGRLLPTSLLVVIPVFLLSIHLVVETRELQIRRGNDGNGGIVCEIPADMQSVEFIDFSGLRWERVQGRKNVRRVRIDGRELVSLTDFNLFRSDAGARLLFTRPVRGRIVEVFLQGEVLDTVSAHAGGSRFALGVPRPFRVPRMPNTATVYRLGEVIDLTVDGNSRWYAVEGWSEPESWGCWSDGERAQIKLRLTELDGEALLVQVEARAYVHDAHDSQKVEARVNGRNVASRDFRCSEGGRDSSLWEFDVPADLVPADGVIVIEFLTPDAASPDSFDDSGDKRALGIGVERIRLLRGED